MVRDSESHRQEDEKRRSEVEARNNADSLIYQAEKLLREQGEKAPAEVKSEVEAKIAACRTALQGQDLAELQRTVQDLSDALQKLSAAMYEQPGTPPSDGGTDTPPSGEEDDVVEGEFSEA